MAEQIGNYNILKKIGAGGMAQVFLAVHKDVPNLKVVLKVLSDQRLVERFKQEADKLALLDGHGHICQIKHFFNHGDDIVIAMEYIDGSTIEDIIKNEDKMPIETATQITASVLDTLGFAHQKGIYHRDIKPGNIMVDKRGHVKIIDFGIAKGDSDPNLTIAGSSCGTPAYMPPEQFNPTEDINYALTDVYAVGTTLFYMLTGKLPFTADNAFALRDAKLFNDPVAPRNINPDIPKELEKIILKSIDKEPEARYQSVGEMKAALEGLGMAKQHDLTEHIVKSGGPVTPPPPTKSGGSNKKLMPIIAAGGLLVVLIVVGFLIFGGGDEPIVVSVPNLTTPIDNDTLDIATPVFNWQGKTGNTYALEIADDPSFTSAQRITGLTDPQHEITVDMADGRYYWRVTAYDKEGNASSPSQGATFVIKSTEPLEPTETTGVLELSIKPNGTISIDDSTYGRNKSSMNIELSEGRHIVRVENKSSMQKQYVDTISIVAGETSRLSHTFTIPAATPNKQYGEIRVGSKPYIGAVVFIDGKVQEQRTNTTFRVETGKHTVKAVLTVDGVEKEKTEVVEVTKNGSHKLIFDFTK
ncbi:MAG: serine/threonine-protein kinase [Candidatus Zixiibacteriota bacterium]